jgi:hypothetical protein
MIRIYARWTIALNLLGNVDMLLNSVEPALLDSIPHLEIGHIVYSTNVMLEMVHVIKFLYLATTKMLVPQTLA